MAASKSIFLYHFTHIANLPGIAKGGLVCKTLAHTVKVDASLANIQERRQRKVVACGPGGVLHDYAPFYFGHRSPMMYLISKGEVPSYKGTQHELIYLVARIENILEEGLPFVFTDGHPIKFPSKFYESLEDLSKVDWQVIKGRWWNDTPEFPDRERRRQAEFLVHQYCPWSLISYIGVVNEGKKKEVERILAGESHIPQVLLRRHWYY